LMAAIEHEAGHVIANDNFRRGVMRWIWLRHW
jgi:hypothetical protein